MYRFDTISGCPSRPFVSLLILDVLSLRNHGVGVFGTALSQQDTEGRMWKIDDIISDKGVNNPWLSHLSPLPIQFVPHPATSEDSDLEIWNAGQVQMVSPEHGFSRHATASRTGHYVSPSRASSRALKQPRLDSTGTDRPCFWSGVSLGAGAELTPCGPNACPSPSFHSRASNGRPQLLVQGCRHQQLD